jgi:hypothetical protein
VVRRVSDYFRDSPFSTIGGRIGLDTGRDDFVELGIHERLGKETEQYLATKPITLRLVVSFIGGGKTWTLSWLWRQFSGRPKTIVIAVPRIELRGQPERGLAEGIFRGVRPDVGTILRKITDFPKSLKGTPAQYVGLAMQSSVDYAQLCGTTGRLPVLGEIQPPSMTKTEGTLRLLLGLFQVLLVAGFDHVLVLIDEVESLFLAYGRRDLFVFSDYIRNLYDEFETDKGRLLPKLEVLFAGTSTVLERVSPGLVGKQMDAADVAQALVRRLAPPFQLSLDGEKDAMIVAEHRIGIHRSRALNRPFIPYDKRAILYVWKYSYGSLGDFCKMLQLMYDIALRQKTSRITVAHAKAAVSQLQVQQEPVI